MDTRDTSEQAELRRSARQLARELGPVTVAGLDDTTRAKRLAAAVRDAGWLELRDDNGDGQPLAGGEDAAIVAEALGEHVADVSFIGPMLAGDLLRRAEVPNAGGAVAFAPSLAGAAVERNESMPATTTTSLVLVDGHEARFAYILRENNDGATYWLSRLDREDIPAPERGTDLTRNLTTVHAGARFDLINGGIILTRDDVDAWTAFGLALTSADLVGVMRGVLDVTVAYAAERRQYGVPVGSFQAVQHLLAEARCLMEGPVSVALHAAWAVDNRDPADALEAGRVAKAYCARAARTVCETAVQVHGGIGNTWECVAHVYLRRALLSAQWFGDDAVQLAALGRTRLGATDGLS